MQEAVNAATGVLQAMPSPPAEADLQSIATLLDDVLEATGVLLNLHETVCSRSPRSVEVQAELRAEAEEDIRNRFCGQHKQEALQESAEALCMARTAVGLVAAVSEEINATTDRADRVVNAMAEARRNGYRVMHLVAQAREYMGNLSAHQIGKIQDEAIEFTSGQPVQALVYLQEMAMGPTRTAFLALLDQLKRLSDGLDVRKIKEAEVSTPTGRLGLPLSPMGRMSRLGRYARRIHPEPDSALDTVDETEMAELQDIMDYPMKPVK